MTIERSKMTQIVDGKVTREAKTEETEDRAKLYWYNFADDEKQLGQSVCAAIKFISERQSGRLEQLTISTRLYGNSNAYSQLGASFSRTSSATSNVSASRVSFNLCASVVDTLTSQIAQNKVIPTFVTDGGTWGLQKKAANLTKFAEGMFYEQDMQSKKTYQFRDCAIWGDGYLWPHRDLNDRVVVERILPHCVKEDLVEGVATSSNMQKHLVLVRDRGVVLAEFPDAEEKILAAMPADYQEIGGTGTVADLIVVCYSWKLPSSPKSKDGLYVVTLMDTNEVIFQKEWKRDYFPVVQLPYSKRAIGTAGQGACERLQNIQGALNREMILIDRSHWMMGSFKVLVENGSKVVSQHLNNEIATIIHYTGTPPQYVTPPAVDGRRYEYVDSLIDKGFRQEGCSQLAAASVKPMGINSGAALRTYDNISENRQLFIAQQVEKAVLDVARIAIDEVKDIYKEKGSYKVSWPSANFMESVDWKDINLEDDEYYLKAFPTSELPEEPSARLETIQEYMQAGLLSPRAGRRLMRTEDIEMSDALADAQENLIMKSIEAIIYDKESAAEHRPDGEWDLQLAKSIALEYMAYCKLNDCPEKQIEELRTFMGYIDDETGVAAQGAPPDPSQPMAAPMPTPQSNMVPNVAGGVAA